MEASPVSVTAAADRRREWHRPAVDHLITMWGTLSEAVKERSWFGRNSQIEFEEGY
jgi:hypothetical protein